MKLTRPVPKSVKPVAKAKAAITATAAPAEDWRKNTHRFRSRLETEGVAMLSAATWVSEEFNLAAAECLAEGGGSPFNDKKATAALLIINAEKGTTVRRCRYDGNLMEFADGNRKAITYFMREILPLSADVHILTPEKFLVYLKANAIGVTVKYKGDGKPISGLYLGDLKKTCGTLYYNGPKGFAFRDVETRTNNNNKNWGVVAKFISTNDDRAPLLAALRGKK